MALIKNIHLLTDSKPGDLDLMEGAASEHLRYSNITFKIKENTAKTVTIQAAQGKSAAKNYQTKKRLIEIVHETFDRFFTDKTIRVQPVIFEPSPAEVVDAQWINKQMLKTKTRLKDMVQDTGIDKTQLSALINDVRPLSQPMKALFWYYFEAKALRG